MIKLIYSIDNIDKTSFFRPIPWHWSTDPFPAFRGAGANYLALQPVVKDYKPEFNGKIPTADGYSCPTITVDRKLTKIIRTQKGIFLVAPCQKKYDKRIMLITISGRFYNGESRIQTLNADILTQYGDDKNNSDFSLTKHLVVRLTDPKGYVFIETRQNCGNSPGLVEVFSWEGYKRMEAEEFELWRIIR